MATEIINIKIDGKVKKEAQKVARELGLSLSGIIKGCINQFVKTKTVSFTADEKKKKKY